MPASSGLGDLMSLSCLVLMTMLRFASLKLVSLLVSGRYRLCNVGVRARD